MKLKGADAVLYADVIFVLNLVMDGWILFLTAWLARKKVRRWRLFLGALSGAGYAILLFFPVIAKALFSPWEKVLFSFFILWITFCPQGVTEWIRLFFLFYLASFLTGGAAFAINALFQGAEGADRGLVDTGGTFLWLQPTSLLSLFFAVLFIYGMGRGVWKRLVQVRRREEHLWQVKMEVCGQTLQFSALLDTGNALTDPLSGWPVAVAEWSLFRSVLPSALVQAYAQGSDPTAELGKRELDAEWQARLRFVPYRGVGRTGGLLIAFRPDGCICERKGKTFSSRNFLVGLNPEKMSADDSYQMILPASFFADGFSSGADGTNNWKGESIA